MKWDSKRFKNPTFHAFIIDSLLTEKELQLHSMHTCPRYRIILPDTLIDISVRDVNSRNNVPFVSLDCVAKDRV